MSELEIGTMGAKFPFESERPKDPKINPDPSFNTSLGVVMIPKPYPIQVALSDYGALALKSDGSIWAMELNRTLENLLWRKLPPIPE